MSKIAYKEGAPIPKSLGRCVDEFHEVQSLRLAMEKEVKLVKRRETELHEHLLESLSASDDTGVAGQKYRAQVIRSTKPTAEDWEDIYDYVVDKDSFDILGRSLNAKAIQERWDAGKTIPGVGKVHVKKLSVTKL